MIFPFLKAFYYEIARVTKQKYFIYAFNTYYLGLLTLIIGIGLVFLLASLVFWILAWVEFKEFDKQEISNKEKFTIPTQKVIFDFDLKWIKITMVLSLVLFFVFIGLKFVGGKIKCRKRKIKCRIFATNYLSFNLKLKL